MHVDGSIVAAVCGVITVFVTTVVQPAMAEWRATRLREWTLERDESLHSRLSSIDHVVRNASENAEAAYHTANNVNEWREKLTNQLLEKSEKTLKQVHEVKAVTTDTNKKVNEAVQRPAAPLFILGSRIEDDEDGTE